MYSARIILITLMLLFNLHSHAQKYSLYGAVADSNREVIYRTDFDKVDENNKDWEEAQSKETHDSLFYAYIKDGILEVTNNTTTGTYATAFPFMFYYTKDFEIEFRVRLEEKYREWSALVFWGRDSTNDAYNGQFLYFQENATYNMRFCSGEAKKPCDHGKYRNMNNTLGIKGDYNTYTIRKIKNKYYVFINKEYSHRFDYMPLQGNLLGFGTGNKSVANMDYIQVSYLKLD